MTNVEKIIYECKYNLRFMNNLFVLSGFNHIKSIHIKNEDIYDFLRDTDFVYFDEEDWDKFVKEYNKD